MSILRNSLCFLLLLVGVEGDANASYFEFCKLDGVVKKSPSFTSSETRFILKVKSSVPATCGISQSDNPDVCRRYIGKSIKIGLPFAAAPNLAKANSISVIQRVFLSDVGPNPGYRIQWQLKGTGACN